MTTEYHSRLREPSSEPPIARWCRVLAEQGHATSIQKLELLQPLLDDISAYNSGLDDSAPWRSCDTLEARRAYRLYVETIEDDLAEYGSDILDAHGGLRGVVAAWARHWDSQVSGIFDTDEDSVLDPRCMPFERDQAAPDFSDMPAGFERAYQLWWWCGHPSHQFGSWWSGEKIDDSEGHRHKLFVSLWVSAVLSGWPEHDDDDPAWDRWSEAVAGFRAAQRRIDAVEVSCCA